MRYPRPPRPSRFFRTDRVSPLGGIKQRLLSGSEPITLVVASRRKRKVSTIGGTLTAHAIG